MEERTSKGKISESRTESTGVDACKKVISKEITRRGFLKSAALATVAISASAGLAKGISTLVPVEANHQRDYLSDIQPGDKAIASWKYEVMSDKEKKSLVSQLVDNYKSGGPKNL